MKSLQRTLYWFVLALGLSPQLKGEIAPVQGAYLQTPGLGDLAISGNYIYSAGTSGLKILDISNRIQPFDVGYVDTNGAASQITVSGHYAYVIYGGVYGGNLSIFDLSNPTNAVSAGQIPGRWTEVSVWHNFAYLTIGNDFPAIFVSIYDVSNPSAPVSVGSIPTAWAPAMAF